MMKTAVLAIVSMVSLADCFSVPTAASGLRLRSNPGAMTAAMTTTSPRRTKSGALGIFAGVDPGTDLPNLDAFYFSGVALAVVGAGLLQAQAGAGEAGLGKYLSTGPEDKNWERKQAKANEENKARLNEENKGGFFANLLPKLDFVEVYGQDAPEPTGREELEQLVTKGIKESDRAQMLTDLNKQLDKAIEREDMALAAEIQSKIAEISS